MTTTTAEIEQLFKQLPRRRVSDNWTGTSGQFLRAAFESILDVGIAATSTYEIAERAGTYQGRLRYYFPTKEQVFHLLLAQLFTTYEQQLADIRNSGHPPDVKLLLVCESGLNWITEARDEFTVFIAYWAYAMAVGGKLLDRCRELNDHFISTLGAIVVEGEKLGTFKPDSAKVASSTVMALVHGFGLEFAMNPDDAKVDFIRRCLRTVLTSISR